MIFSPPTLVPSPITVEQSTISQIGITTPETLDMPLQKATPKNNTPINFCPSCAPCMKLMAAAPKICATRKKPFALRRSSPAHRMVSSLQMTQPLAKPSARLMTRPYKTLTHSLALTPPRPFWMAMAAPVSPAIRLWLSEVGMPK